MLAPQSECVKILRYERNLFRQYVKVDISKPEISYLVVENKVHCTFFVLIYYNLENGRNKQGSLGKRGSENRLQSII